MTDILDPAPEPVETTEQCPIVECSLEACFKAAINQAIANEYPPIQISDDPEAKCDAGGFVQCWMEGGNIDQTEAGKIGECVPAEHITAFANVVVRLYKCGASDGCESGRIMNNIRVCLFNSILGRQYDLRRLQFEQNSSTKNGFEQWGSRFQIRYLDQPTKIIPPPK